MSVIMRLCLLITKQNEDKYQSIDLNLKTFFENKMPPSTFNNLMKKRSEECAREEQEMFVKHLCPPWAYIIGCTIVYFGHEWNCK
jgi:hypothetical protein